MLKFIRKIQLLLFILVLLASQMPVPSVKAALSGCTVSVVPTTIVVSTATNLSFNVANSDSSNTGAYVKFTAPSSNFTINSGSASGWSASVESATVVSFTGGTIPTGSSADFTINVTGAATAGSASWTVVASDNSGGGSSTTCTGSTGITVASSAPDGTAPTISSLAVSDVSQTSVKITWTTDEAATSVVYYGTSDEYGSTKSDSSLVTSHSVELTDLTANTLYHYDVESADGSGNTNNTGDNTFVSSKAATTSTTTVTNTTTKTETKTVIAQDTAQPGITLATDFEDVYAKAPRISGSATDNIGVTKVEYSLDDGKNWLPVDFQSSIGGKSVTFYFTPEIIDDGNYAVRARATDPSGNVSSSKSYTLIIDRLPPLVGGQLFSVGPQVLVPQENGLVVFLSGIDHQLTFGSVGGAVETNVTFGDKTIPFSKNPETGLWSEVLSTFEPGLYSLSVSSVDGAQNKTERTLTSVYVVENGRITEGQNPLKDAVVKLYVFEPVSQTFVLWNGESYGQTNPQNVTGDGHYYLYPPAGKYYLEISSPGFYSVTSAIFTLDQATPIATDFVLKAAPSVSLGPWRFTMPNFGKLLGRVPVSRVEPPNIEKIEKQTISLLNQELPVIDLRADTGTFSTLDLTGKPTVVTLLSTWLPQASQQLTYLVDVAKNTQVRIVPVMLQESLQKTVMIEKGGGYGISILADPDGLLIEPLDVQTLPMHLFLDRKGVIRQIEYGVMTSDEILDSIVN